MTALSVYTAHKLELRSVSCLLLLFKTMLLDMLTRLDGFCACSNFMFVHAVYPEHGYTIFGTVLLRNH